MESEGLAQGVTVNPEIWVQFPPPPETQFVASTTKPPFPSNSARWLERCMTHLREEGIQEE